MRPKRVAAAMLRRLIVATILLGAFGPPTSAQSSATDEAAIRAALTQWTDDFNAGNTAAVCDLFAPGLRYDYRGFPERGYQDICDGLRGSLTDQTTRYHYSLAVKDIVVSSDLAAVRLTWTLQVTKPGAPPQISQEPGIDIFRKQPDGAWKIVRFIAYEEPG
jgi:steroid delta-isomerase